MSKHRISQTDRFVLDGIGYRRVDATATGLIFARENDDSVAISLTDEEIETQLANGNADLQRRYFEVGAARNRIEAPTDKLQNLPDSTRSETLHRLECVTFFSAEEIAGRVKRTARSVNAMLPRLETHMRELAALKDPRPKRARRKRTGLVDLPGATTLLEWNRRYQKGGCDVVSLIPHWHRCGNKSKFCAATERLIGKLLEEYLTFHGPKPQYVATTLRRRIFAEENERRRANGLHELELPSISTIHNRIKALDPFVTYVTRFGAEAANKKFGLYEDGLKASFPMEIVMIDGWKIDVIPILEEIEAVDLLPDEVKERLVAKRLWLYLALDVATRCVVGIHLCERENAEDAIRVLAETTRDKSKLAFDAGAKCSWHHGGGLGSVITDQGSAFLDDRFRSIVLDLLGTLGTPPAGVPRLRGPVERIFLTFGTTVATLLAGKTGSNPRERGDYPSEDLAVHDIKSLKQIFILHIVDIYHNTPQRGLKGEMPSEAWERLSKERGALPYPSAIQRCAIFGVKTTRKITGRGVRVFGIDYACDLLREMHKRAHGSDIKISVNPENLGWIMVWSGAKWVVAHAIQECFDGVSLGQWHLASRELRLKYKEQARLKEHVVDRALTKIIEINQAQMDAYDVRIPVMTTNDIERAERQLHLGLTIDPERYQPLEFPDAGDLPGSEIPMPEQKRDLFNLDPEMPSDSKSIESDDGSTTKKRRFGMEDDE